MKKFKFNSIEEAISALKNGEIIILMDDEDRENEGDLCVAAEFADPQAINFMTKYGRGLICLSMEEKQIKRLQLPLMTSENNSQFHTNFTVSIEAAKGVTTGISVFDRALTIKAAINPQAESKDIVSPGHIFPLQAKQGGTLRRAGQTEGSVDLAKLAGLNPSAVICEILAENGSMARQEQLMKLAKDKNLKIVTINDLIKYRLQREIIITKEAEAELPTKYGKFKIVGLHNKLNNEDYVALTMGSWKEDEPILTRVHSQCLTGDVFSSLRCDCQAQLTKAMELISEAGKGVILYLPQEGRGIGILKKIMAYHLQEGGKDTVEANEALGYSADLREYGFGAQALRLLGLRKLKLMTNNPRKIIALDGFNLKVVERIPIEVDANSVNKKYLDTKKNKLGHLLDMH